MLIFEKLKGHVELDEALAATAPAFPVAALPVRLATTSVIPPTTKTSPRTTIAVSYFLPS
jgi:hypothetical protein